MECLHSLCHSQHELLGCSDRDRQYLVSLEIGQHCTIATVAAASMLYVSVTGNLSTALLSPYHHSSLILPGHPSNYHGIQAPIHGASRPSLVTGLAIPGFRTKASRKLDRVMRSVPVASFGTPALSLHSHCERPQRIIFARTRSKNDIRRESSSVSFEILSLEPRYRRQIAAGRPSLSAFSAHPRSE